MKKTALLMLCASVGGCADAGAQLPRNDSAYPGNASYGASPSAASNSAIYELLGRLEQLQSEVQQLRGLVEEQGHTIADLQRKQDNMYADLDERIQVLSSGGQSTSSAASETTESEQSTTEAAQSSEPAVTESKPGSAAPAATSEPVKDTAQQTSSPDTSTPQASQSQPAALQAGEQERYQQAYETLRNGHNAQAIQMFEALYADYPNGEYGDNAQYWLGEAYKISRDLDKARAAFNKVINQYPGSPKVPDAMLKLGYIEFEQQNMAKARDYFTRITTSYPTTTAAHLAAKKLMQMPQ